ncbi:MULTISPECIES: type II toxin-antitoxin system RelE/ParE family toxin [Methylobacterium]|uniref:Toxin n=1 Tax=Methylobacterium thuringiense TaxID=1003091 RepID=A0ABQ4TL77_9HYPH|nr:MULTISPECIES: type II toxin-antitoxin system RelE/ParE family toxin [Methylobacterium]TXN24572.1 type II toxin-antitoxin system RelE/ParE family toxin [Methylobacterium sp. WL9]GJE55039.1 Toxin ParE1 [Methylobacterium thuringiense]
MGFTLSPRARADLDGIWDYTAEHWNADQADRYIRQLAEAFGNIADGSIPGRAANDIRKGYFKVPVGSHVVFYRHAAAGDVVVIRVLHQRMDVARHL